jgi:hypothetical protein
LSEEREKLGERLVVTGLGIDGSEESIQDENF